MAYQPVSWATDPVDPAGDPTKVIPSVEIMRTGLQRGEPMGRQWFNYMMNYLLNKVDPGVVPKEQSTGQVQIFTKPQPDLVASGAWRLIKTEKLTTPVTVSMYYYEHTGV